MKALLIAIFCLLTIATFAQSDAKLTLRYKDKGFSLDSIFPIDNIKSIKVKNNSGTHLLTAKELTVFKTQLKQAKFAGGLLVKPGHIFLQIKLKDEKVIKPGYVYASTGSIHFDEGVDKFKETFSGTFDLPTKFNFDKYK